MEVSQVMKRAQQPEGLAEAAGQERSASLEELFQQCYAALRQLAHHYLRQEREAPTLSSSGLLHEVYLKLAELEQREWRGEAHLLGVAAHTMRRVLVDSARRRRAAKRQVGEEVVEELTEAQAERLLLLQEALERLAVEDEAAAKVAELRCFGGLGLEECAQALELSYATVRRRWEFAKAWLRRELAEPL